MSLKAQKRCSNQNQTESFQTTFDMKEVERRLKPNIHLWLENPCGCCICQSSSSPPPRPQTSPFIQSSQKSHEWLKKILLGLTQKTHKTLKLFLPDILFLTSEGLEVFSTNKKDYRIIKFAGTTPIKSLYSTLLRLRKEYKGMLQQNFRKTMIDQIDPKYMHAKYYDRLLPSHFHDGDGCIRLNANKARFRSYVLHKNQKYILSSIEEHKMNEKEPFCTIRYIQGQWQLLNQRELEMLSLMKIPEDIVYVQSYIKSRESQAFCFSTYTEDSSQNNQFLFKKAQNEVLVLLGGIGKYDQGFDDLENFEDQSQELMKTDPEAYSLLMTYKIVHFLSMVASVYVRHIKVKWIINDIDNVYLQEIIQFDTDEVPKRHIRYKLPPTSEVQNFYRDSRFFLEIHRELQHKKEESTLRIRKSFQQKSSLNQNPVQNPFKFDNQRIDMITSRKVQKKYSRNSKLHQLPIKTTDIRQQSLSALSAISGRSDDKDQPETIPSSRYNKTVNTSQVKEYMKSIDQSKTGNKSHLYSKEEIKLWRSLERRKLNKKSSKEQSNLSTISKQYQTIGVTDPRRGLSLQIKRSSIQSKKIKNSSKN